MDAFIRILGTQYAAIWELQKDIKLWGYYRAVLIYFKEQYSENVETIDFILKELPFVRPDEWIKNYFKSVDLEKHQKDIEQKIQDITVKESLPYIRGYRVYKEFQHIPIRNNNGYLNPLLIRSDTPLTYTFHEGIALMIQGLLYDIRAAHSASTSYNGS